jgi:ribonuclease D
MNINIVECDGDLPTGIHFPNGMVAIDTETLGLNVKRDRLCLCQLADGTGNVWLVKFDGSDYSAPNLKKLLADPKILKLFHFARFDMAVLSHALGTMPAPVYCTKIASRLTRTYTDRHSLKALVEEIIGESLDKNEQSSDWAEPLLTESQKHYAASDVLYLHTLKEALDEKLTSRNRRNLAQACFGFLESRVQLDLAGWETTDIFAHH